MRFVKFQAFGNDYIVFEAQALNGVAALADFACRVCAPHYGAGADGIVVIEQADATQADFNVRIFNPDGGEAGLSGNGTRCAAAYLYHQDLWRADELRLRTPTRATLYRRRSQSAAGKELEAGAYVFDSELGCPTFDSISVPFADLRAETPVRDYKIKVDAAAELRATVLSVGNPHCVFFVPDFDVLDWRAIGAQIEHHELFPERTNVEFVRVLDERRLELRIWERGVGETHSSGTCASAAAVAAVLAGKCVRDEVDVITPGGVTKVVWRTNDNVIVLTGSAQVVYEGRWLGGAGAASKS